MIGNIDKIKQKNRRLGMLLGTLFLVITAGVALPAPDAPRKEAQESGIVGKHVRQIEFIPYDRRAPYADPAAKPYALLEFFTPHCGFCRRSVPELNRLAESDEVAVVAYTSGSGREVKTFVKTEGVAYPVSHTSREYSDLFNPVAVPVSFLVDTATLEIKARFVGKVDADTVLRTAQQLTKG